MNSCKGNIRYRRKRNNWQLMQSQDASLKSIHQNDTLLNNIQQKVLDAFVNAKISQSDKDLIIWNNHY